MKSFLSILFTWLFEAVTDWRKRSRFFPLSANVSSTTACRCSSREVAGAGDAFAVDALAWFSNLEFFFNYVQSNLFTIFETQGKI